MADMTVFPSSDRFVVIDMEAIKAVTELSDGTYCILVSGEWIVFPACDAASAKSIVETYFGEWEE